jgi:hypothetical protein
VVAHAPDVSRAFGFGKRVGRPGGRSAVDWMDILRLLAILGMAYGAWELWRRRKPGGRP